MKGERGVVFGDLKERLRSLGSCIGFYETPTQTSCAVISSKFMEEFPFLKKEIDFAARWKEDRLGCYMASLRDKKGGWDRDCWCVRL